eukprot:gnl/Hemi2/26148_TR8776_c0_g1_i1.p1 gnl/Hemi2/26148_TR8776_c0_g1~~gnl/Hemi2/26148_TR8776_c0_g1_i1.p1  ORF type:complete len:281 (+),score=40.48 gnl/Hemi2/26148_TR8776_c0_g1_i1:48-845(+)
MRLVLIFAACLLLSAGALAMDFASQAPRHAVMAQMVSEMQQILHKMVRIRQSPALSSDASTGVTLEPRKKKYSAADPKPEDGFLQALFDVRRAGINGREWRSRSSTTKTQLKLLQKQEEELIVTDTLNPLEMESSDCQPNTGLQRLEMATNSASEAWANSAPDLQTLKRHMEMMWHRLGTVSKKCFNDIISHKLKDSRLWRALGKGSDTDTFESKYFLVVQDIASIDGENFDTLDAYNNKFNHCLGCLDKVLPACQVCDTSAIDR